MRPLPPVSAQLIFMRKRITQFLLFTVISISTAVAEPRQVSSPLDEIVVTSRRVSEPLLSHAGNIASLASDVIEQVGQQHIHELMTRVPGTWVSRGSGQEHLTAIRSPVLTGAGSCGAFLILEDGIPVRPAGFCNVNQMFEVIAEQAHRIEVIRGPGNALYGSNALHGTINVVMPRPGSNRRPELAVEAGPNQFFRVSGELPFQPQSNKLLSFVVADDGGFRDASGYRQAKVHLKGSWRVFAGDVTVGFSATDLDQETAGFILGQDSYRDDALRFSNANPEAFREASSQRLYARWVRELPSTTIDIRPYVRRSDMTFLQHFLPGQPLEENGHESVGLLSSVRWESAKTEFIAGLDMEYADLFLRESQDGSTVGSAFLMETRPAGEHYDYDVAAVMVSPFVQGSWRLTERLQVNLGARFERIDYDYENHLLVGNTRDDGTTCGFGGCLYTRPADRRDAFSNFAPKFSASYTLGPSAALFVNVARGFRAPQATELYRLQSGQLVSDLDTERADSIEIGFRSANDIWAIDTSAYAMRKRGSVLRDGDGFNVSNGKSRHHGIETSFRWQLGPDWRFSLNASYSRHEYDFDLIAARGETFVSGRDIDTAPRWLGNAELQYSLHERISANLQWTALGEYYLDAEKSLSLSRTRYSEPESKPRYSPGLRTDGAFEQCSG